MDGLAADLGDGHALDGELGGVEQDLDHGLAHLDDDAHGPGERGGIQVGLEAKIVALRDHGGRQAVVHGPRGYHRRERPDT